MKRGDRVKVKESYYKWPCAGIVVHTTGSLCYVKWDNNAPSIPPTNGAYSVNLLQLIIETNNILKEML